MPATSLPPTTKSPRRSRGRSHLEEIVPTPPGIFVCPECHGPLQEIEIDQVLQFQCRVDPTEHGAALADAVSGARRLWGYRIPAVVFLEADDPEDTTAWYVRGATCVIRIPRSARRVRVVAVAAFRYWLDVVTLPPAW